jgi:drug/metabolite transporter (DMT)-like permease
MGSMLQFVSIGLAVVAVAIADVFLKKASLAGDFTRAVQSPWTGLALMLYAYQTLAFIWVFVAGWRLSVVGMLQTVLYALIVVGVGVLYFKETLTVAQGLGVGLALAGVVLMNLET